MPRGTVFLLLLTCLSACADDGHGYVATHPSLAQPAPVDPDANLRLVAMPTGNGLAFVREDTAAQALCHALTPQEWQTLAGGDVSRSIDFDTCTVQTPRAAVTLAMDDGIVWEESRDAEVDVAGFAVRIDDRKTTALVAFAPDLIGNYEVVGSPVLTISTHSRTRDEAVVPPKLLSAVLPALLPRLRPPGPSVPVVHSTPLLPLRQPPGTALIDLTGYVAGSVVCTLIAEKLNAPAEKVMVRSGSGSCDIDNDEYVQVSVFWPAPPDGEPDGEVAGLPYHEERSEVAGRTRIDRYVELTPVPGRSSPVVLRIDAFDTFDFRPAIEHVLENVEIL